MFDSIRNFLSKPYGVSIIYICWILLVIIIGGVVKIFTADMFRFGPPNAGEKPITFLGNDINSWNMIYCIMGYSFINQFITSYRSTMYYPWIVNNIYDNKVRKVDMHRKSVFMMMNFDNVMSWISYFIDLNILFTMEFQFIVPRLMASVIVTHLSIMKYLSEKDCIGEYKHNKPNIDKDD